MPKLKKKKSTRVKRVKSEAEALYQKAVKNYLAGNTMSASRFAKAALVQDPTHRKAQAMRKRLTENVAPNVIPTKDGRTILKDGDGHFMPGQSANPAGRPVGSGNKISITKLIEKMEFVEETEKDELLVHLIRRAYKSDTVLLGVFKKLLPDLKVVEGLIATAAYDMSEEEAAAIQETLRRRYENTKFKPDTKSG